MAALTWLQFAHTPWVQANDFTYSWFGARSILSGIDPYTAIKGADVPWEHFLFYPLTTFVLITPFASLPAPIAGAVFFGLSAGFLAFVLVPHGRWRLLMFASAPMFQAATSAQWSPFLVACSLWVPAIGCLAVKPNLAIPLMAMQTRPKAWLSAVLGGTTLLVVAFGFQPHWVPEWLAATRIASRLGGYRIPILSPLGAVVAFAVLRWRRPEARLLLALACVPQKMMFYDQLPLLLIPNSKREMQWAVAASVAALVVASRHSWLTPETTAQLTPPVIVGLFWPALVMLLRRPNAAATSPISIDETESAADLSSAAPVEALS